jgi:hypothetical protein
MASTSVGPRNLDLTVDDVPVLVAKYDAPSKLN